MSKYQSRIQEQKDGTFFALVVRVDESGYEYVSHGYKSRYFKTRAAAEKSTTGYIKKYHPK